MAPPSIAPDTRELTCLISDLEVSAADVTSDADILAAWEHSELVLAGGSPPSGFHRAKQGAFTSARGLYSATANAQDASRYGVTSDHIQDLWTHWLNSHPDELAFYTAEQIAHAALDAANAKTATQEARVQANANKQFSKDHPISATELLEVWDHLYFPGFIRNYGTVGGQHGDVGNPMPRDAADVYYAQFFIPASDIQQLWGEWIAAKHPGDDPAAQGLANAYGRQYSAQAPSTIGQIQTDWDKAYGSAPGYVKKIQDPMPRDMADRFFAQYFVPARDVQTGWSQWVALNHPNDDKGIGLVGTIKAGAGKVLDDAGRVISDVAKGNLGDAISDTGSAFSDTAQAAWNDTKAGWNTTTDLANDVVSGVGSALSAVKALALKMDPAGLINLVSKDLSKFVAYLDHTLSGLFPTVTLDGNTYAWNDAKKDPKHVVWYLAAVAKTDTDRLQKSLFGKKLI
jgi:hypothetical protein